MRKSRSHIYLPFSPKAIFMMVHIMLPLFLGSLIYMVFRKVDELWVSAFFSLPQYEMNAQISDWIVYNLPDGLWLYAFVNFQLLNWDFNISRRNWFWIMCLPLLAILSEYLQYIHVLNGTADIQDVIIYTITTLIILLLNKYFWRKPS